MHICMYIHSIAYSTLIPFLNNNILKISDQLVYDTRNKVGHDNHHHHHHEIVQQPTSFVT